MKPTQPWVQILRERYARSPKLMHNEARAHDSLVWKTICKGLEVVREGTLMRIGNGQQVSFWDDVWMSMGCV